MLNVEKLNAEREKAFCVWFERWYKKKNIEKEIEIANNEGYTGYKINLSSETERDAFQMRQEMFISLLREKLPGMQIYRDNKTTCYKIFGTKISNLKEKVIVKWA